MIVTVTPNPALDLTWHVTRLVPGETHRADAARVRAGGKGLNVARVAASQGADVLAVATRGGDTGSELARELGASAVPHRLVPVAAPTRRSVAIVDPRDATVVNELGVAPTDAELRALVDAVATARADVLVVSGSLAPRTPLGLIRELLGAASGAVTIVDTWGPALLAAADAGADVLKPNRAELAAATGEDDPLAGARALLARGARLVLVSLGADGMIAVPAGGPALRARPPERVAGNPTGAGDAAVAAVAVALDAAEDREALLAAPGPLLAPAIAWSAAAVLMPVAGEISARHHEFAAAVRPRPIEEDR